MKLKFDWKKLKKNPKFWAGVAAVLGGAGIALPPGTVDALMLIFAGQ